MKTDHNILGHRGTYELASGGTAIVLAIVAAGLGAISPLGAALAVGGVAAWIGHYLDCHYARGDVSRWRTFGLVATLAASLGWVARMLLDSRHASPEDSAALSGAATVATVIALAASAWRELRESREP